MPQEGRGIGLINKLRAYELQEQGMDTLEHTVRFGQKGKHMTRSAKILRLCILRYTAQSRLFW